VSQTFAGTPGNMHFPMTDHSAVLLEDGSVLLAGGEGNGVEEAVTTNALIFNPHSGLFFVAPPMLTGRNNFILGTTPAASNEVLAAGGARYITGSVEGSITAAEIFVTRRLRFVDISLCLTHPLICQLPPGNAPHFLSGIVHRAMVITRLPAAAEDSLRDRKSPVAYKITISGLGDNWEAGVVTEDGMPLNTEQSDSRDALVLTLAFKNAAAFEAARDNSLLVFQMTSKAVPGKEYPVTIKAELASRPRSAPGSKKP